MLYINGQWQEGRGAAFSSENPASGETVWQGNAADALQVEAAVAAARGAFPGWRDTPLEQRIVVLQAFQAYLETHKNMLAAKISEETGKVSWDASSEAAASIGKLKFSLAAYDERTPTRAQDHASGRAVLTHRPHGVLAVYGPYNFPAHLPGGHIIPALLAGNTVVFKPSEMTPGVGEWLVQAWEAAGLPAGVLNLVQGEREVGMALSHADIDGLLFTGSSATGKHLHAQFAGRPEILLALELGGNNPLIVSTVSDLRAAALETILSAYISSGQRCTCARRLILVGEQTAFLNELQQMIHDLRVGAAGESPEAFMGPVIRNSVAGQLLDAQQALLDMGASSLMPMRRLQENRPFLSPGLIDVTNIADVPDREDFGPLLKLIRTDSLDEAITIANQTAYGLSAGLLSDSATDFEQASRQIRAGIFNWNQQTTGASGMAPFGGVGQSGNHHPAGFYAADYCAYPQASMRRERLVPPEHMPPGLSQ